MGTSFNVENFVIMQHISFASGNNCKRVFAFDGKSVVNIITTVGYVAFTDRLWQKAKGINRITFIYILGEIRTKDDYGIQTQLTDFMSQLNAVHLTLYLNVKKKKVFLKFCFEPLQQIF